MYEAKYSYSMNETGSEMGWSLIGYFNTKGQAKQALRGLCPWDFNSMWGSSYFEDGFSFTQVPGSLNASDDAKFIREAAKRLVDARHHARESKGSWHHRAPENWGEGE